LGGGIVADVRPTSQHSEPRGSGAAVVIRTLRIGLDAAGYPIATTDPSEIATAGALTDADGRPELTTTEAAGLSARLAGSRLLAY
jgi:hypothetical protein